MLDAATVATRQTGPEGGAAAEAGDHPAANRWSVLPRMLVQSHGLAGGVISNRLHLVSGDIQSAGIPNMAVRNDVIENGPEPVERYVIGMAEAAQYTRLHPDEPPEVLAG